MLKSSREYLQALRQSNYLSFLEWPRFIATYYKPPNASVGFSADNIVDLLVFDWINNGYQPDDARAVAVLYKLNESRANLLPPELSYSALSIFIAVLQCMIYHSTDTYRNYRATSPKSAQEIIELMRIHSLQPSLLASSLQEQQNKFSTLVEHITIKEMDLVLAKITPIVQLRRNAAAYAARLEQSVTEDDGLDPSRLSVVKRLLLYLDEQAELSDSVQEKIKEYVVLIRTLSPRPFEEPYLAKLAPTSLVEKSWRLIATVGYFFSPRHTAQIESTGAEQPKTPL